METFGWDGSVLFTILVGTVLTYKHFTTGTESCEGSMSYLYGRPGRSKSTS